MSRPPHLTDAALAAALDPLDGGNDGVAARAHAAECLPCAALLREAGRAERQVAEALHALDHPVPSVDMARIVARAAGRARPAGAGEDVYRDVPRDVLRGSSGRRAGGSHPVFSFRRARWGLGLTVLGLAAAAAAVTPRSPLRQLFARVFAAPEEGHAPGPVSVTSAPSHPSLPPDLPRGARGVAVVPSGPLVVQFRSEQRAGVVRIIPGAGERVAVRASGDGPTYGVGRDTVVVDNSKVGAVTYDVEIPAAARSPVRVRIGDRVVYSRAGDGVRSVVAPDPSGQYVIPLVHTP